MAQYANIGKVVPLHRGEYDAETAYRVNDLVSYQRGTYWHQATAATTGILPTDETTWVLVVPPADTLLSAVNLTLPAAGWADGAITVNAAGVTETSHVIPAPAPGSRDAYIDNDVYLTGQAAGTLTFAATYTPTTDIVLNVIVVNI